jgi:RNA polymerase sigma-70 factor (ECF subfamily)
MGALEPVSRSDEQLIVAASAGSVDAFGELYDRYCLRSYQVALAVCRDASAAQDAVQEAFVSIWMTSASYRSDRGPVAAWLLAVVRHRAIDLTRRERKASADHASDEDLNDGPGADDPVREALANERADQLQALLNRLPDTQREVIRLAYYGQLSHTEIAAQLGLPTGTVKGRMRLGMHKLRAHAEPQDA